LWNTPLTSGRFLHSRSPWITRQLGLHRETISQKKEKIMKERKKERKEGRKEGRKEERKKERKEGRNEERKVGKKVFSKKKKLVRAVVADAFNPSIWEAEADRLKCSRPAWSTQ